MRIHVPIFKGSEFKGSIVHPFGHARHYRRKRAEEERARSAAEILRQKDLLAVTLASIGDGVIVTDAQGRVTFLNGEAERLTGWTSGEAEGHPLPAVFHIINEHTRQPVEDPVEKVLRLGTVVGLANHTILIAKDGRETPIDDSGAPIRQSDGTVQGVVLVFRDFTEQKQAERSLARLAAIVESSNDAILSKDLHGIIQTWNAGADRLFGYRAEEVIGRPITLLLPPERIQEEEQILERLLSGQRVEHLETVRVTKDGRRIDVSVTVSPVKDQDGQIIGASKIVHDITDRKRAEESLARERKLLRTLIDNLPDCVYVKDTQSRFLAAKPCHCASDGCCDRQRSPGKVRCRLLPAGTCGRVSCRRGGTIAIRAAVGQQGRTPPGRKRQSDRHPDDESANHGWPRWRSGIGAGKGGTSPTSPSSKRAEKELLRQVTTASLRRAHPGRDGDHRSRSREAGQQSLRHQAGGRVDLWMEPTEETMRHTAALPEQCRRKSKIRRALRTVREGTVAKRANRESERDHRPQRTVADVVAR